MNHLYFIAILVSILNYPSVASSSPKVLVTRTANLIQWTCFDAPSSEACCQEIQATLTYLPPLSQVSDVCKELIATVPTVSSLQDVEVANYSLILTHSRGIKEPRQHAWVDESWSTKTPTSPFIWTTTTKHRSLDVNSSLSQEGGMHRVMSSSIQKSDTDLLYLCSFFLIMTIPQGMFIDLDDFLLEKRATLHFSGVVDIEKPSFMSGQHVVIVEIPSKTNLVDLNIFTKWHLRYPSPTQKGYELIQNIIQPQLLVKDEKETLYHTGGALEIMTPISVGAGYEQDHDLVTWGTVLACWIGVWIMLRDISRVSYWDP